MPLVAPARGGDRVARQRLFEVLHPGLRRYLLHMTRDDQRADDLTQEAFARALTALPRLREDGAFRGWLFQIASNLLRDEAARATELLTDDEATLDRPDPSADPSRRLLRAELATVIRDAVAALPPDQRAVVVMHHFEGLEVSAIAQALGLREGTVKSRLGRGREVLRRRLTPWMEG